MIYKVYGKFENMPTIFVSSLSPKVINVTQANGMIQHTDKMNACENVNRNYLKMNFIVKVQIYFVKVNYHIFLLHF